MKKENLPRCIFLSLILSFSFFSLVAQENVYSLTTASNISTVKANSSDEDYSHVFIYYPLARSGNSFSIFLNKKNIGKLTNGGRIECKLLLEGPIAITLIEGSAYHEPLTQSRNSRTITIKKGKSYYFRVNGTGELEYIFNPEKGEKSFAETKEFVSRPTAFIETPGSIPTLSTVSN